MNPTVRMFGNDSHVFGSDGSLPKLTSILDEEKLFLLLPES